MMMQELHMAPSGLYTDPDMRKAPPGALRTANNVVIRRDGIVEPRPGFNYVKALTKPAYTAIPYKGNMVCRTSSQAVWYSNEAQIYKESSGDLGGNLPTAEEFRGCEARNNLYIPCTDGVRKLTAALDTEAEKAGPPAAGDLGVVTEGAGVAVANNTRVRYRAIIRRTDANNVITRGTPSCAMVYLNNSGGTVNPQMTLYMSGDEKAGDVVELYRSAAYATTVIPDEELYLAYEYTLTSANISTGYITITDTCAAADSGATLYTSPSQEGALQENATPPKCADIALFKNSLFYANTELTHRKILRIQEATDADQSGDATGIGRRLATANTTDGSTTLDNISLTTGLVTGQLIVGAGIPANTYIKTIGGTIAQMTKAATATQVGVAVQFWDSIIVGTSATSYEVFSAPYGCTANIAYSINLYSSTYRGRSFTDLYCDPSQTFTGYRGTLGIYNANLGASKFYVWGTHGEAYFPTLTGPVEFVGGYFTGITTANGIASDNEDHQNRIYWSKADQPEHVPEINYIGVGSENYPIFRIIPTKDALFVFKSDGIWRLTGAGAESGWRVDEFDLSTALLCSPAITEMNGAIYAWTNKGLVRITDAGIEQISATAIGHTIRNKEYSIMAAGTASGFGWVEKNPKDNEIILSARSGLNESTIYIFNTKTLAWYAWVASTSPALYRLVYNPSDHLLYWFGATGETGEVWQERRAGSYLDTADRSYSVTISAATGTSITINSGSGWTPTRGDAVYKGTADFIVTAASDVTHFTVNRSGLTTGAATAYKAFTCAIEWMAKTAGNEGSGKHYADGGYSFSAFNGIYELYYSFWSSLSASASGYYEAYTASTSQATTDARRAKTARFIVPSAHARVSALYPSITITQALAAYELNGLSLYYRPMPGRSLPIGDATPGS